MNSEANSAIGRSASGRSLLRIQRQAAGDGTNVRALRLTKPKPAGGCRGSFLALRHFPIEPRIARVVLADALDVGARLGKADEFHEEVLIGVSGLPPTC